MYRTGASSLEQVFMKIGRMSSGPGDLEVSRFFRASKTSSTEKESKERGGAPCEVGVSGRELRSRGLYIPSNLQQKWL